MLRQAPTRQSLVRAIYFGKKHAKSVLDLADILKVTPKRITEIGKPLANTLFGQERIRINGRTLTAYVKYEFVQQNLREIIRLAGNPTKLSAYNTKTNPRISFSGSIIRVKVPFRPRVFSIAIDDVKEFSRVKQVKDVPVKLDPARLPEAFVKRGLTRLLGEPISAKDWGGELNDIFTTRLTVRGKRNRAAFALKGPAKSGGLVPKMMGKNGDQILRLFKSPAQVFFVQYEGEIKESIVDTMREHALAKAATEGEVFYGVIDLTDTYRLRVAYSKHF
jgi:hypothetical protein